MTVRHAVPLLALLLAAPLPTAAEPFTLFVYETPAELAARTDPARAADYWGAYAAYAAALQEAGVLKGGQALRWGDDVRTVRGAASPATGPVAVAGEQLGGYFTIEVADLDAALAWAAKAPAAATGAVEVRPAFPAPAMR